MLAGVVAHSAWTSRRNAPRQALPEPSTDTAAPADQEPTLSDSGLDTPEFSLPQPPRRPVMDSLIDVIATVALDPSVSAVSGEAALAALPSTRRAGTKPFSVEGYNLHTLV